MHSILKNLKKREGFTLIELMIVVAIIGILAAIAIPNFIKFQLRSKASEGKINLAAIRTAQESFFAEVGTYFNWSASPGTPSRCAARATRPRWAGHRAPRGSPRAPRGSERRRG